MPHQIANKLHVECPYIRRIVRVPSHRRKHRVRSSICCLQGLIHGRDIRNRRNLQFGPDAFQPLDRAKAPSPSRYFKRDCVRTGLDQRPGRLECGSDQPDPIRLHYLLNSNDRNGHYFANRPNILLSVCSNRRRATLHRGFGKRRLEIRLSKRLSLARLA